MASIGSVPSIGKTKLQKSVFLPNGSLNKTRFILSGLQGKNGSSFGFSVSIGVESYLGLSLNCVQRINGCSRRQGWRGKCKAAKGEDGGEANDALEATIEKSKKVLAMQRDLLLQIAERRKLVSSIKNSIMNAEEDGKSYNENDQSYSDLDLASTDSSGAASYDEFDNSFSDLEQASIGSSSVASYSELDNSFSNKLNLASTIGDSNNGENPSGIFSGSYVTSTSVDAQRGKGEKKSTRISGSDEVSLGVDFWQIQERSSEKVESELISFLPSETYGLDEKLEELTKMSSEDVDGVPVEEDVKLPPLAGANVMNVILVAAECAPWIKTGGLGDVAGSLPKALARRGHRVMVVVPQYAKYAELKETGVRKQYVTNGQSVEVTYSHAYLDGVDFVFIESSVFRHMEKDIYGGNRVDILKRMILFCKAAVEVPWHVPCGGVCYGDGNLVFIANDWHTALLPVYLKAYYRDNGIMRYARSVLVIHNIAHQGRGPLDDFSYVDLPEHYIELFKLYDPVGGDHFNIFAAGLKAADRIVTVSHGYAWELKTSEGGWGLHEIINENDWKLRGIVNGIDTKEWNPEVDVHLTSDGYANYSLETLQIGKAQCKAALQKELGLQVRENVPLIGFVGRLDPQKGVDLIAEAIPWMMDQDVQLVMLGSGRPDLEQMLRQYESQYHNKIRGWVGFSVKTAHRITAGADILLMPSRFEPCGLNQLYAMKYGTVPVVHGVGGLRDTVQPFDPYKETGLGWTFDRAEANRLIHALANCLLTYREYKPSWEGLQRRGMMQDLSWDNAAQQYEEVLVAAKYQW